MLSYVYRFSSKEGSGLLGLLAFLIAPHTAVQAQEADRFDPAKAFCERQTFDLESLDEVAPWLDYVRGLRTGYSNPPAHDCASTTARTIVGVVASQSQEEAEAKRAAFHGFYAGRALEPESSERAIDPDGSFRYRNDVTLATFVWLLCPGTGEQRYACVEEMVGKFPVEFTRTSPVFCDFGASQKGVVERVPGRSGLPLECQEADNTELDAWFRRAAALLGE